MIGLEPYNCDICGEDESVKVEIDDITLERREVCDECGFIHEGLAEWEFESNEKIVKMIEESKK
ncbi:hypothetical protein P4U05_11385 [Bacillus paranthracis]|uniref:hypothetical protein n=1 Tax=Bacillus TaxID=1386 RepID=UPI000200EC4D|nr:MULTISPECIES: hypothetical protein [Bacillus cereus group]ADY19635.1 hypothetical protein YBT020_01915 [Bacillus thuringiensis serovar finitimus YBT-020]EJR18700.1 hypothetical protein II9_01650 [Bacillus cereus MSX-D12]KMP47504.1 hypothetical protein TU55_03860 [Bacillus cereus]MRC71205.1 hypothetical protein [Bacillus thuringiensis]OTX74351.1 hypothetical protein BK722_06740 [Bacillus thuringiensis serovar finitimus]HDR7485360.1 hypothetical protein [Bacillus pacificus]